MLPQPVVAYLVRPVLNFDLLLLATGVGDQSLAELDGTLSECGRTSVMWFLCLPVLTVDNGMVHSYTQY